jgi:hypothetical protein
LSLGVCLCMHYLSECVTAIGYLSKRSSSSARIISSLFVAAPL